MPKKVTTFSRPCFVDQLKKGAGTIPEIKRLIAKLERDGAANKTIRRLREVLRDRAAKELKKIKLKKPTI